MGKGKCVVCGIVSNLQCSGCNIVYYCGPEHQTLHWRANHKSECCCYKVVHNEVLGRHLVATRQIKAGEVIIKECPMVFGPKIACSPICLGCHKSLQPTSPDEETPPNYYKCSGCGWPLCAPRCEKSIYHISECRLMEQSGYYSPITYLGRPQTESAYCTILPLRCLILEADKLETLLSLESHIEERMETALYQIMKTNIVGFTSKILGVERYDEFTMMKIAAILDTNTFEIRRSAENIKMRGLYAKASMLSHNCMPNTKHTFHGDDFSIVITATVDIKKRNVISTTYTQTLWSTSARQKHLRESKYFTCTCIRCSDPTEFGLYVGGLVCSNCNGKLVSRDPISEHVSWKCVKCPHNILKRQIDLGNETFQRELEETVPFGIDGLEKFLNKYNAPTSVLHPTNTFILQAKHALTQLYSEQLQNLTYQQLQYQIKLCEELLEVANQLEPGITRFRGILLYDLQAAKVLLLKHHYRNGLISEEQSEIAMTEATKILQESAEIFKTEPDLVTMLTEKIVQLSKSCA